MGIAQGIISLEQAREYGWLWDTFISGGFLDFYNASQKDGEIFICGMDEKLPKYLEAANFEGANLIDADLTDVNLRDANLKGANLKNTNATNTDFTGANLSGAELGFKVLKATHKWHNVDFTDLVMLVDPEIDDLLDPELSHEVITNLKAKQTNTPIVMYIEGDDLLDPELSRKIIINRMIELKITDAKGLGDGYQTALANAGLLDESPKEITSKSEDAPASLAKKGFITASNIPNKAQIKDSSKSPNIDGSLDLDEFNP